MFGLDLFTTCLIGYFFVSACVVGVWYEVDPPDRDFNGDIPDEWMIPVSLCSAFWGVVAFCALVLGILWCLSWIPRLPTRLILRRIRRSRLPEAKIV